MNVSKFVETEYGSTKEILKFPDHYVALAVMVDDDVPAVDGKKIVPKGTIVGGKTKAVLDNLDEPVVGKYAIEVKSSLVAGTAGEDSAVLFTALAAGDEGDAVSITITDPGTASQDLTVTVSDKDITISLATGADTVEVSTAKEVADAVNADTDAKLLVAASYYGDGAGVVAAKSKTSLAGGADSAATGAEGVLMNDVDVTHGDKEGAMLIHGFVAVDKLPYGTSNVDAAAKAGALLGMVKFIK